MEKFKELLSDLYGLTALLWVELHLILIVVLGKVMIYEANGWILGLEIAYTGGAVTLSVERLIKDVAKLRDKGREQ